MLAAPLRGLIALVLMALMVLGGGCSRTSAPPAAPAPLAATTPTGNLQEVPPPGAVQQLSERLRERQPQVVVLAPADGTVLPAGPWALKLRVSDWPLADAGELGLGPHLVVQIDGEAPLRLTSEAAAANVPLPELSPGSHRVTVYAARPWGEAVKSPGASTQIRVHRVAANPPELPATGSPQLIASSPNGRAGAEPVLVDWLLFDAPLQRLRDDDGRWRLRVSVNGDSFLVDRQTPLWLKGFRSGSNAVQLELLDGRGDPLNPPFNSVVQEVVIQSSQRAAWQKPGLSNEELDRLSGVAPAAPPPAPVAASEPGPEPEPEAQPEADVPATPQPDSEPPASLPESSPTDTSETSPEADAAGPDPDDGSANTSNSSPAAQQPEAETPAPEPPPQASAPVVTVPTAPPDRIAPGSTLKGSARDQVNADGSLLKPKPSGPLAGLREKLQG
jgi:hypothetical protein